MIRIYGHSDDNVELEEMGAKPDSPSVPVWREEIGVDRLTLIVGGKQNPPSALDPGRRRTWSPEPGVRIRMRYYGVWVATIGPLDEDVPMLPVKVTARNYTAVVEIEAPEGVPIRCRFKGSKKLINARDVKALNTRNDS